MPPKPAMDESERKSRARARTAKWREKNADKFAKARAAWAAKNQDRLAESCRRYQASKLKAVPAWADRRAMALLYFEAKKITAETGIPHEVDHVVPLRSAVACGLHCEANLRVVPKVVNRRKGNKLIPEEVETMENL